MAEKYPSSWKKCATCVYWTGPREVDFFGQWVTIGSTAKGRCMCRTGPYRIEKDGSFSCFSHQKWPALS